MKIKLSVLTLFILFISTGTTYAEESQQGTHVNTWVSNPVVLRYKGEGYSDVQKSKPEHGDVIYSTSTTQPGLYLSCIGAKLRAGLVFEPRDMKATFRNIKVNGIQAGGKLFLTDNRRIYLDMRVNSKTKSALGRWVYNKAEQSAMSAGRKPAAKLYNTVARGQRVEILIASRKPVVLDLPKPNQAFAEFGAGCGIGILAKKE